MLNLLEGEPEGWCSNYSTIPFITKSLNLAPTFAAAFGASLVVDVELRVRHVEEILGKSFADCTQLMVGLISEHVYVMPIDGTIIDEKHLDCIILEHTKPSIGISSSGPVNYATWNR